MSEIKTLEDMRNTVKTIAADCDEGWILGCLDAIEGEIAERFVELPVDADGVPIRVGDELECHANGYDGTFTVFAIGNNVAVGNHDIEWVRRNPSKWFHVAQYCVHVEQRTLEDVMAEYEELAANQNVKDYFKVSKELQTIQSEQFRDEPELELYKEVNGCRFYIELPYDELWIMTDKVEVKHHSYSYRYERPNGNTVMSCSSLCGYPREWAIERLDEAIEEIRELLGVGE